VGGTVGGAVVVGSGVGGALAGKLDRGTVVAVEGRGLPWGAVGVCPTEVARLRPEPSAATGWRRTSTSTMISPTASREPNRSQLALAAG
jgi:hypothetical protein